MGVMFFPYIHTDKLIYSIIEYRVPLMWPRADIYAPTLQDSTIWNFAPGKITGTSVQVKIADGFPTKIAAMRDIIDIIFKSDPKESHLTAW